MTKKTIIRVSNLSKQYRRIRHEPKLRHDFGRWLESLWTRRSKSSGVLMALKNISFEVHAGESLAIIGRNGAGKSSLLRILCGISRASSGSIEVNGNFIAILSPQVGFIGSRTGHENIYLLAAMYGVMPKEINKKLDSIIQFAELQDAIYEPVDHYSSGMRARLGFSIVIHIAPEILFVDEALAVGDTAFQEKCLAALKNLLAHGHTLVFISHAMDLVRRLCTRAIWLEGGSQIMDGEANSVVDLYENDDYGQATSSCS